MQNPIQINFFVIALILLALIYSKSYGQTSDLSRAQSHYEPGGIKGKLINEKGEVTPFILVRVLQGGVYKGFSKTDIHGNFIIRPLNSGTYKLQIGSVSYENVFVKNIQVNSGRNTTVKLPALKAKKNMTKTVTIAKEHHKVIGNCIMSKEVKDGQHDKEFVHIDLYKPFKQELSNEELRQMNR